MASTSFFSNNTFLPMASNSHQYPPPLAAYEEVTTNPKLFMATLEKLHAAMGTKFMIPIIGGKELDLCRLFVEVTSRGGIEKIIKERRWKEVTQVFNFPSTATNASFVLRKYYSSLLYHYEQIYYFKASRWTPATTADALQGQSNIRVPSQRAQISQSSPGIQSASFQQQPRVVNAAELPGGSAVVGIIDAKFESGYLVTVTIGSEQLKGVLYQDPHGPLLPAFHQQSIMAKSNNASAPLGVQRRRRRKKSEIKRRDPAHPKPNRSGYNFFFAEQHARLKPLHQAKDREISRMIGELWNKLKEPERSVYQEKAIKDKERYKAEMEDYRQKLRMNQVIISDAVPLQQRFPEPDTALVDVDIRLDDENDVGSGSPLTQTPEESSSGGSENDINMDYDAATPNGVGMSAENAYLSLDKASKEGNFGIAHQQVQKIDESKNMLALL